jgi:hypothetical protein
MFAVVVLGIGFIMLAAVFPVAIKQSKMTSDETRGVAMGREAAGVVQGLARGTDGTTQDWIRAYGSTLLPNRPQPDPNYGGPLTTPKAGLPNYGDELPLHIGKSLFPPTGENYLPQNQRHRDDSGFAQGVVRPVWTQFGWDLLRGNMIVPNDHRYAWTVMYRRDGDATQDPHTWSPLVQLFIIVANARTRDLYLTPSAAAATADLSTDGPDVCQAWVPMKPTTPWQFPAVPVAPYSTANLYPRYVSVEFEDDYLKKNGAGPDRIRVKSSTGSAAGGNASQPDALAEGCYGVTEGTVSAAGRNIPGRVYRLGAQIAGASPPEYELVPGNDMKNVTENTVGGSEWVMCLGREYDPAARVFKGPAQDIYLYTALISIVPRK